MVDLFCGYCLITCFFIVRIMLGALLYKALMGALKSITFINHILIIAYVFEIVLRFLTLFSLTDL